MDPLFLDPCYLLRLHKRLVASLITRGDESNSDTTNVIRSLTKAPPAFRLSYLFTSIDTRFRDIDEVLTVDEILDCLYPLFNNGPAPKTSMSSSRQHNATSGRPSGKDLQLIRELLPMDRLSARHTRKCLISPGEVLFLLLQLLPLEGFLVDQAVQQARSAISALKARPLLEKKMYSCITQSPGSATIKGRDVVEFLVRTCCFTVSHALLVAHYCKVNTVAGDTPKSDSSSCAEEDEERKAAMPRLYGADLDADLVYRFLFEPGQLGDAEAYPLLALQFVESAVKPFASHSFDASTGSLFLLKAIDYITSKDSESLPNRILDEKQFQTLCWMLGTSEHIIPPLFHFLAIGGKNQPRQSISVHRLMQLFCQHFPSQGPSMFTLRRSAVVQCLQQKQNPLVFLELFNSLRAWGTSSIPIEPYVHALRAALAASTTGRINPNTGITDIDLESFRCLGKSRVKLLFCLIHPVHPGREAVIQKVCSHLAEAHHTDGGTTVADTSKGHQAKEIQMYSPAVVYQTFCPEKVEGGLVQRQATKIKEALKAYLIEISEGNASPSASASESQLAFANRITVEELIFFLQMISAGLEDTPTFTMLLWQGFGMADAISRVKRRSDN